MEVGVWDALWERLAQSLDVGGARTPSPPDNLRVIELEEGGVGEAGGGGCEEAGGERGDGPPAWTLVSMEGLTMALDVVTAIFVKVIIIIVVMI